MTHLTSSIEHYQDYFSKFLPAIIGRRLIEELKSLNCQVEINVTDLHDPSWFLTVQDGILTHIKSGVGESECTYLLDSMTLVDIVMARYTPQEGFFANRIQIEGDIERGLSLNSVLAEFFERFPYVPSRSDQ